jgi:chromosome partitioning protein
MRTLAIASRKGGSGKTTTAVSIAAAFARDGRKVLLVDADPQGSATSWLRPTDQGAALFDLLTGARSVADCIRSTGTKGVSIIPADPRLAGLEKALADEVGPERIMAERLEALDGFDVAILDTPPALGILSVSALVAADGVLVTTEPTPLALAGVSEIMRAVESVRRRLNRGLELVGVLVCRSNDRRNLTAEAVEALRKEYGRAVFGVSIPESVKVAECPSHGVSIFDYDPNGAGALGYREAADEVSRRMKRKAK